MLLHVDLEDFVKQISLTKVEVTPAGSCQLPQTFFFLRVQEKIGNLSRGNPMLHVPVHLVTLHSIKSKNNNNKQEVFSPSREGKKN